jgi:hypothetical protein
VEEQDSEHNMWLLKPGNMNRGRNIVVFSSLDTVAQSISEAGKKWVVQKYIERPLLFQQRKFDVRMWVLLCASGEAYAYQTGYLRTASSKYSSGDMSNSIHLTNNAVQLTCEGYGQHEDGNQLSFAEWQQYIDLASPDAKMDVECDLVPAMHELIRESLLAVQSLTQKKKRDHSFELLGYDFMVDEDFHIWLIEVNTNPCLANSSKLLETLLPQMINDLLRITVDPIFPPSEQFVAAQKAQTWVKLLPSISEQMVDAKLGARIATTEQSRVGMHYERSG